MNRNKKNELDGKDQSFQTSQCYTDLDRKDQSLGVWKV